MPSGDINGGSAASSACLPGLPSCTEWVPVGGGESGDRVYRRTDGAAYAKVALGRGVPLLDGERRRTEWLAAFGQGSPRVLDWIACGDRACLVTAPVPGVPASDLGLPDLRAAWPSIACKLKALHDLPVARCPFERRLSTVVERARDVVARDAVNPEFLAPNDWHTSPSTLLARLLAELPERLAQEPRDLVVCHGDACLPNLMVDPETLRCTRPPIVIANARERWEGPEDERAARDRVFDTHAIRVPDGRRLAFYLALDPLTWGW